MLQGWNKKHPENYRENEWGSEIGFGLEDPSNTKDRDLLAAAFTEEEWNERAECIKLHISKQDNLDEASKS